MAEKLSEKIYKSIRKDITEGRLSPREFFSEAQFAEKYNVSKAPVRDALHLLVGEGYLVSFHRKGYMINTYSIEEINEIQELRRAIEHLSVDLVIKNASDEDIRMLYQYIDNGQRGASNRDFHMGIAKLSGNRYLPETLDSFLSRIYAAMRNDKTVEYDENHKRILDALLARDAETAHRVLNDDIAFL